MALRRPRFSKRPSPECRVLQSMDQGPANGGSSPRHHPEQRVVTRHQVGRGPPQPELTKAGNRFQHPPLWGSTPHHSNDSLWKNCHRQRGGNWPRLMRLVPKRSEMVGWTIPPVFPRFSEGKKDYDNALSVAISRVKWWRDTQLLASPDHCGGMVPAARKTSHSQSSSSSRGDPILVSILERTCTLPRGCLARVNTKFLLGPPRRQQNIFLAGAKFESPKEC